MNEKHHNAVPDSRRRKPRLGANVTATLALVMVFASPLLACPMCKDSTVDTGPTISTAQAPLDFNKSIYIMLGGFVSITAFTGRVMYKAVHPSRL